MWPARMGREGIEVLRSLSRLNVESQIFPTPSSPNDVWKSQGAAEILGACAYSVCTGRHSHLLLVAVT